MFKFDRPSSHVPQNWGLGDFLVSVKPENLKSVNQAYRKPTPKTRYPNPQSLPPRKPL